MKNYMRIGLEKLNRAKTVAQIDKVVDKTCTICAFRNDESVTCKGCPFRIEADIKRYAMKKRGMR